MATEMGRVVRAGVVLGAAVLLFVFLALWRPVIASAATVTVTTTGDTTNACATSGAGTCSLRDAVTFANNHDSTAITFSLSNPSTITLTGGDLELTRTTGSGTTITGPGAMALAIDGNCTLNGSGDCTSGGSGVFAVATGVTASISGVTIQHGNATNGSDPGGSNYGGAIFSTGTLTVTNSTITACTGATGGGGISNAAGILTVTNSTISHNRATNGPGGGIYSAGGGGTLTVTSSTITNNGAAGDHGGGIAIYEPASVTNSTISNNIGAGGGGIYNSGTGAVTLTNNMITGNSSDTDGGGLYSAGNGGTLTVTNNTISNNTAPGIVAGGGGIYNVGALTVTGSTLSNNAAPGGSGGGIYDQGSLTVTNSTFSGNSSAVLGGGIAINTTTTVANSTFSGNSAGTFSGGGGIGISSGGNLTLTNSTISGNTVSGNGTSLGGGIKNKGRLSVTNSTISANTAAGSGGGGGIDTSLGTMTMTNSIVAGNSASSGGPDLLGTITSGGHNLIGGAPLLGALGNYGGATQTMPLLPGSPAIDAGDDATCAAAAVGGKDQRAITRPQGAHCDIGAFESRGFSMTLTSGDNQSTAVGVAFAAPLVVTVTSAHSEPVDGGVVIFTGPASGAGITPNPVTGTIGTVTTGRASATATANGVVGTYIVTATANGASGSGSFHLTNQGVAVVVNNSNDGAANAANCAPGNGNTCRLRDAIATSTAITFDATVFPAGTTTTITLSAGTLVVSGGVAIDGTGHNVIVDGGCTFSDGACASGGVTVFSVYIGATLNIKALTIQHGNGNLCGFNVCGGGVYSDRATLTVTNSTIRDNTAASDGYGGGIYSSGTLTVTNSTLSGNSARGQHHEDNKDPGGGGIYNDGGVVTVTNSTITGNNTFGQGTDGGGMKGTGTMTVTNTIIAGNSSQNYGPDLYGTFATGGHNLFGDTSNATITLGGGDLVNPNPLLGTLSSNGGPTQTIALLTGSPAIAHGDPTVCIQSGAGKTNSLDQRGVTRPATLCAIGAFEPLLSAISVASGPTTGGATVTLTGAGYAAGAMVSIGGVSCTNVQIVNSTTLRCTTGAHAAGTVDVVVSVGSATGTLTGGYTYGVVNPLPPVQPSGGTSGSPNPLPGTRPAGTTGGPAPNPLPAARP